MKKRIFTGSGVAVVTPMYEDGSLNYDELQRLINFQIDNDTDAIIICGTTGESATLTEQEHLRCIETAVRTCEGRIPVVAGVGSNNSSHALWLSKEAKAIGADGLLHVTPYYNKTSQLGLIRHFNIMADATDLPIIVYNVPSRTGLDIKPETYKELSKHPNIVAAKEANGNISSIAQTAWLCGDELDIYSGNDDQIVPILSLGGIGVISVLANILPRECHKICELYLSGAPEASKIMQLKYLELINALFSDVSPMPVKEALLYMGFNVGGCRLPLVEMNKTAKLKLLELLRAHNLI